MNTDCRRQHERIPISLIVMYEVEEQQKIEADVQHEIATPILENLSETGMMLTVEETLPKGLLLRIYVSTMNITEYLEIMGEVIWSCPHNDDLAQAGVRFVNFTDNGRDRLIEMLEEY